MLNLTDSPVHQHTMANRVACCTGRDDPWVPRRDGMALRAMDARAAVKRKVRCGLLRVSLSTALMNSRHPSAMAWVNRVIWLS